MHVKQPLLCKPSRPLLAVLEFRVVSGLGWHVAGFVWWFWSFCFAEVPGGVAYASPRLVRPRSSRCQERISLARFWTLHHRRISRPRPTTCPLVDCAECARRGEGLRRTSLRAETWPGESGRYLHVGQSRVRSGCRIGGWVLRNSGKIMSVMRAGPVASRRREFVGVRVKPMNALVASFPR